jgi:hypothetical protein
VLLIIGLIFGFVLRRRRTHQFDAEFLVADPFPPPRREPSWTPPHASSLVPRGPSPQMAQLPSLTVRKKPVPEIGIDTRVHTSTPSDASSAPSISKDPFWSPERTDLRPITPTSAYENSNPFADPGDAVGGSLRPPRAHNGEVSRLSTASSEADVPRVSQVSPLAFIKHRQLITA